MNTLEKGRAVMAAGRRLHKERFRSLLDIGPCPLESRRPQTFLLLCRHQARIEVCNMQMRVPALGDTLSSVT